MKHVLVYGMTDNPGGMETYIVNLFLRVQGNGVMLDFITDFETVAYEDVLTGRGARIYHFPPKSKSLTKHWGELRRVLKDHPEYSAVYFNILDAGAAVTMLVPYLMGRKVVVHSHNNDTEKKRLHRMCRPLLRLMATGRAACSESAAAFMFGPETGAVQIVPNVIDAGRFAFDPAVRDSRRRELGLDDRLTLCHVGRLAVQKNPIGLIDIFSAVRAKCPSAMLLSVGDGDLAEEFERHIREKGLDDCVMRLGVRNDIPELLQAADVFVLPSLYEGLGIVVLEAQAAGLPSVVSDAVPEVAVATDLVTRLPLSLPPEQWAERILEAAELPRENTFEQMVSAGYDVSCCEEHDRRLIEKF